MTDRELLEQALDALDSECSATISHAQETIRKILEQPKKEWVGLTDEDKSEIVNKTERDDRKEVMDLVEAKLKEKNAA